MLIVGHSNTVPDVLKRLGVQGDIAIGDMEFDNLFVVVRPAAGEPTLVRLGLIGASPLGKKLDERNMFAFERMWRARSDRRAFLLGGLALIGAGALTRVQARPRWDAASPFSLGVASGDPTDKGVVLWTRLAPDPLAGGGMSPEPVEVRWELADDEAMRHIVKRGRVTATAAWAHSVHVEVDGLKAGRPVLVPLSCRRRDESDRPHPYDAQDGRRRGSPAVRVRILPALRDRLFTAYRHMAAEDLDVVFHLGDYIYEGPGRDGQVRKHQGLEIMTLPDYRNRYAQYKLDPDLQAAHAAFPFIVTPDDHEVENNYAGAISETERSP